MYLFGLIFNLMEVAQVREFFWHLSYQCIQFFLLPLGVIYPISNFGFKLAPIQYLSEPATNIDKIFMVRYCVPNTLSQEMVSHKKKIRDWWEFSIVPYWLEYEKGPKKHVACSCTCFSLRQIPCWQHLDRNFHLTWTQINVTEKTFFSLFDEEQSCL